MQILEKVRIGGVDYAVKYEQGLNNGEHLALGHIDFDKALIQLAPGMQSYQGECQTLLHEVLHGISDHFGLDVGKDEDSIDKLSKGLYMVISDNPEMFMGKEKTVP